MTEADIETSPLICSARLNEKLYFVKISSINVPQEELNDPQVL